MEAAVDEGSAAWVKEVAVDGEGSGNGRRRWKRHLRQRMKTGKMQPNTFYWSTMAQGGLVSNRLAKGGSRATVEQATKQTHSFLGWYF